MESIYKYEELLGQYTYDIYKSLNGYIPIEDVRQLVGLQFSKAAYYHNNETKFNTFLTNGLKILKNSLLKKYLSGSLTSYGPNAYSDYIEVPLDESNFPVGGEFDKISTLLVDLEALLTEKEMEYAKVILLSDFITDKDIREKLGISRHKFRLLKAKIQKKLEGVLQ